MNGETRTVGQVSRTPAATLFGARVVYAFNWYNVGAVLPLIGASFAIGTATLGIVLGAFLVGVGIFQIPAGFASLRFGARRVSLFGLVLMGAACLASAFSPSWEWLAVTRGIAGAGAAFFFSPALGLISSYYPPGNRGVVVGLYNGAFSLGGAIGLFGGALLGTLLGWQWALAIGGVGLLVSGVVSLWLLPVARTQETIGSVREIWATGRDIVGSRSIWALALGLTGFWGAIYIVAQYFVQYADQVHASWGVGVAAGLASLVVVVSFPGGPIGGWLGERGMDRRLLLGLAGALASGLVLTIPFTGLPAIWALMLLLGLVDGMVFAILYLIPSYLPESGGAGLALGVGVVNSIQVLLGSGLAIAFGFVAAGFGFDAAWLFAGIVSFATLPLLLLVRPNRGMGAGRRVPVSAQAPVGSTAR